LEDKRSFFAGHLDKYIILKKLLLPYMLQRELMIKGQYRNIS